MQALALRTKRMRGRLMYTSLSPQRYQPLIEVALCAFLTCTVPAQLSAQASLQITSPADGAVVASGQAFNVTVTASGTFDKLFVVGEAPIGFLVPVSGPPYQLSIPIPSDTTLGKRIFSIIGVTPSGQSVTSK